jgi:hypothetical protein
MRSAISLISLLTDFGARDSSAAICKGVILAIAPDAVTTFRAATQAMDAGDHREASRLFEEVLREAPTFSPALRRPDPSLRGTQCRSSPAIPWIGCG